MGMQLPIEIIRKILLMLPAEKLDWITDTSFWNEKIERDFAIRSNIDAKEYYKHCKRIHNLIYSIDSEESKQEWGPQLCKTQRHEDEEGIEICVILLYDIDIYLKISSCEGWLANRVYEFLLEYLLEKPCSMTRYCKVSYTTYTSLAEIASEHEDRTEKLISSLYHSVKYLFGHIDGYIFIDCFSSIFTSREIKASWLVDIFLKSIFYSNDSFITEEQISIEAVDNKDFVDPCYITTWGSDNETWLRSIYVLVDLRDWLSKHNIIIEDIPLAFKPYPPYNSKDIKDHIYWIVINSSFVTTP